MSLQAQQIKGAWTTEENDIQKTIILSESFLSVAEYKESEFIQTWGGTYKLEKEEIIFNLEFSSSEEFRESIKEVYPVKISSGKLEFDDQVWTLVDDGTPDDMSGAWIFTGRVKNGETTRKSPDLSRKTMKVLSGTRFQWIAYDVDKKAFMGSGGGTYTTSNGKYTENIDFFSRDNSRVGASLEFDFERENDTWYHKGLSSKGNPINEIWSIRK